MLDHLEQIIAWREEGQEIALATVIRTWGSSPRPVGSSMVITSEGEMAGSVSGGCVESAVVESAFQVLENGASQLLHFGVADETAWEVGLACGGEIDVFIRPLAGQLQSWQRVEDHSGSFCSMMAIGGPETMVGREWILLQGGKLLGGMGGGHLEQMLMDRAQEMLRKGETGVVEIPLPDRDPGALRVFMNVHLPQPRLVAVGGVHIAIPLMSIAKAVNYRTVVVDPRKLFATPERFPEVDMLLQSWPEQAFEEIQIDQYTAVAMLTHDPKIDDPALQIALHSDAFYVGALGSTKTQADRRERLLASGVREEVLDRMHAPIGLDLGGGAAEEIALAVMAEVVREYHR